MLENIFTTNINHLSAGGLTFMIIAMGTIICLNIFCFYKVFFDKSKGE